MLTQFLLLTFLTLQSEGDGFGYLDIDFERLAASANEAYMGEDYDTAISLYLDFLEHNSRDATALYNLACCYGLEATRNSPLLSFSAH